MLEHWGPALSVTAALLSVQWYLGGIEHSGLRAALCVVRDRPGRMARAPAWEPEASLCHKLAL
jgi:hypothetical protein